MIYTKVTEHVHGTHHEKGYEAVTLTWDERHKRVLRVTTTSGREVGIRLEEAFLSPGDILGGENGEPPLLIEATFEPVLVVTPRSKQQFGYAAHFIGNRHIQAWISDSEILVRHDDALAVALNKIGIPVHEEVRRLDDVIYVVSGGGHTPHGHH